MSRSPGSFYNSVDTWSSTLSEAESHARFHAVDDSDPHDGYTAADFESEKCKECEDDLDLLNQVDSDSGEIYFECSSCGAEYSQDEIPNHLHPEVEDGEEENSKEDSKGTGPS